MGDNNKAPTEELLQDLRRVSKKLNKTPTSQEYTTHGRYCFQTLADRFDTWNNAKEAAGLKRTHESPYRVTDDELLKELKQNWGSTDGATDRSSIEVDAKYGRSTYVYRFGSNWASIVRAGRMPNKSTPLCEKEYESYIQAAINTTPPSLSLFCLLRAFTGMTHSILKEFNIDWISRIDSDLQPPLVRVPSEHMWDNAEWTMMLPTRYTTTTGEKKPTHIRKLVRWLKDNGMLAGVGDGSKINEVINRAGVNTTVENLRASVATHLARQGIDQYRIEMQVGAEKTNWDRSVEDYFLYLYQFEGICHPDYEPSGTYLDPDTGEVREVKSDED